MDCENHFLEWVYSLERPFLPVDISQLSAGKRWGDDRRNIKNYIGDNPLFADMYNYLYAKNSEKKRDKFIPAELEPFFRTFLQVTRASPQRKTIAEGNAPAEFQKALYRELYQRVWNTERSNNPDDGTAEDFCRGYLFEEPAFQDAISEFLWDENFQRRCDMLKALTKDISPKERVSLLKHLITFMDINIAYYQSMAQGKKENTQPTTPLVSEFPTKVLKIVRQQGRTEKNEPVFRIKVRTPQEKVLLKTEFKNLRANKLADGKKQDAERDAARDIVRDAYIKAACHGEPHGEFEEQCRILREYVESYEKSLDDTQLRDEITKRSREYYGSILCGAPIPAGSLPQESPGDFRSRADMTFLEELISCLYTNFCHKYGWVFDYLRIPDTALAEAMLKTWFDHLPQAEKREKIIFIKGPVEELLSHEMFAQLDFMDNRNDDQLTAIMAGRAAGCYRDLYGDKDPLPCWTLANVLQSALVTYRLVMNAENDDLLHYPMHFIRLIKASFACILWEQYRQSCEIVFRQFKTFRSFIQTKGEDCGLSD